MFIRASAFAGVYAGWRVVADDLRAVIERLRKLGDGRVLIDEYDAQVLAVDHVSRPDTFADISLRFVAKVRGWDDDDPEPDRGFLVGLQVNNVDRLVVVASDGRVLGVSADVAMSGLDGLGI